LPLDLRAQAYYLLGNLEFLRREYEAAVTSYDRSLTLIPGDDAQTAPAVGRDAAHNRALALRLRDENKPPPENPDAGPPPEHGDGGQQDPNDDQKDQDQKDKDKQDQKDKQDKQDQKDKQDEPKDQNDQQDPQNQQDQKQPPEQQQDQAKNQPSPDDSKGEPEPKEQKGAPPPQPLSLSQDDKMLDQLERAPTVQQEAARAQRGHVRRVVEDK